MSSSVAPRWPWIVGIEAELAQARRNADDGYSHPTMFPVPSNIKTLKPEAYKHQVLSFGLYDRDFGKRTRMDEVRLQVVSEFLEQMKAMPDSTVHSWDDLCACVAEPVERGQELRHFYYDGPSESLITSTAVRSVLTFDAVFLTVFLLHFYTRDFEGMQLPDFKRIVSAFQQKGVFYYVDQMYSDLWLFENQIPLFLVRRVWNQMYVDHSDHRFDTLIRRSIAPAVETYLHPRSDGTGHDHQISFTHCDHLLHCLYIAFCHQNAPPAIATELQAPHAAGLTSASCTTSPEPANMPSVTDQQPRLSAARFIMTLLATQRTLLQCGGYMGGTWVGKIIPRFRRKSQIPTNDSCDQMYRSLLPVTELHKAGIIVRGEPGSVSHIRLEKSTFFKATLYLPQIQIDDNTEKILRNLSSFELFHNMGEEHKLISYLTIMDDLINTEEDVRLLRKVKDPVIILNYLGDDKDIAILFNAWGENLCFRMSDECRKVTKDVSDWCMKKKRQMFIQFVDRFLDRPWILASLAAATLLLVMTALQTTYTILGFHQ